MTYHHLLHAARAAAAGGTQRALRVVDRSWGAGGAAGSLSHVPEGITTADVLVPAAVEDAIGEDDDAARPQRVVRRLPRGGVATSPPPNNAFRLCLSVLACSVASTSRTDWRIEIITSVSTELRNVSSSAGVGSRLTGRPSIRPWR